MLQEYEMFYKTESGERRFDVFKFQCLITTYEVIIQDVELLVQIDWRCCVIDEAHRLKNKNCKLMEGLRCFELVSANASRNCVTVTFTFFFISASHGNFCVCRSIKSYCQARPFRTMSRSCLASSTSWNLRGSGRRRNSSLNLVT